MEEIWEGLSAAECLRFPIFQDISEDSVRRMIDCFRMRQVRYAPGATVCEYDGAGVEVGVVTGGSARLVRIDVEGSRTILERLDRGSIFGEPLGFASAQGDSIRVVCEESCQVLYINYAHIMQQCENACRHHSQLVHNMFSLAAGQIRRLSRRVEVLSRRSIREKLLCYFAAQAACGGGCFTLPFTLSALADYISADRSAMMRELRKLRQEGLVAIEGRQVRLASGAGAEAIGTACDKRQGESL